MAEVFCDYISDKNGRIGLKSIFDYQIKDVKWSEKSQSLWNWLNKLEQTEPKDFCKEDQMKAEGEEDLKNSSFYCTRHQPLEGPFLCDEGQRTINVKFDGNLKFDKISKLPTGKGKVLRVPETQSKGPQGPCYSLLPSIDKISGHFVKGCLEGKATICYRDKTKMKVFFRHATIQGRILLWNKSDDLQAIGYYVNGLPHGPFWLVDENTFVQIHFHKGHLVKKNIILVDADKKVAKMGTLKNQMYLENVRNIIVESGQYTKDFHVIKIPDYKEDSKGTTKLPIKVVVMPNDQSRIMVRPSRILYFNRVAKTGSLNLIILFVALGVNLGYVVEEGFRKLETVQDDAKGIQKEIESLLQVHENLVKCRHYAFFDLRNWGYDWVPDWFSIVRHPIERVSIYIRKNTYSDHAMFFFQVISYFYYQRASWNIVGRAKEYPDLPLPEIDFLRLDFDTCVLENYEECNFNQNSSSTNHKSQMAQFCGHDDVILFSLLTCVLLIHKRRPTHNQYFVCLPENVPYFLLN